MPLEKISDRDFKHVISNHKKVIAGTGVHSHLNFYQKDLRGRVFNERTPISRLNFGSSDLHRADFYDVD